MTFKRKRVIFFENYGVWERTQPKSVGEDEESRYSVSPPTPLPPGRSESGHGPILQNVSIFFAKNVFV